MSDATGPPDLEAPCYAAVTVPGRVESIRLAAEFIVHAARNMHVPAAADSLFEVAIVEALNNAVTHGRPSRRPGASIVCELELVGRCLTVRVLEQGQGFVLEGLPRRAWRADDATTIPESGFGISIIQHVFPVVRTVRRAGAFGIEMVLTF